jgi:hypothetical protein
MIETKVESQNYLADSYSSSLGHLPFDANQYVILSAINFLFFFLFSPPLPPRSIFLFGFASCEPVTCQMATSEMSFNG